MQNCEAILQSSKNPRTDFLRRNIRGIGGAAQPLPGAMEAKAGTPESPWRRGLSVELAKE